MHDLFYRCWPAAAACALISGCAWFQPQPKALLATAIIGSTSGNSVRGMVRFRQEGDAAKVYATITGLAPNSVQAIHVHERGDCSAPDASSAGAHFNPAGAPHGAPDHGMHHAGDLPNLHSDDTGAAEMTFTTRALSIGGGDGNILGRAVVVHRNADDYTSQPAGNSGPRLGCGPIELTIEKDDNDE
jgi:superoxide dismutase, Cu-Zn family